MSKPGLYGRGYHIGDVVIIPSDATNPYKQYDHPEAMGEARVRALSDFKHGRLADSLTAWYAPWSGGSRKISRADVDWESSGVD